MDQVKKDPVFFVFTLSQFLKEDSDSFLVHLSSNGASDLFVFRLFGSSPVQGLIADISQRTVYCVSSESFVELSQKQQPPWTADL